MTTAGRVLNLARADLGYVESSGNRSKFGAWYRLDGQPWCAMAVSKWFHDAGLPLPASTPRGFAYTPAGVAWFKKQGRWRGPEVKPEPGWVVFFDFPGPPHRVSHVGIVESVRGPRDITTIEGNTNAAGSRTGGMVARLNRRSSIVGYGVPAFSASPPPAPPPPEEDDMAPLSDEDVERIAEAVFQRVGGSLMKTEANVAYLRSTATAELRRGLRAIGTKLGLPVKDGEVRSS